ncbi:MAG: hypothetical protein ACP6IT_02490 [Candidatus Thorarchaeota archaeon]
MPWNIENYYILNGRVLCVEVTIPLMEFLYVNIDDVKQAWVEMLSQFVKEQPGLEISWEMEPREEDALITIRIAKSGELEQFSRQEIERALSATDALIAKEEKKKRKTGTSRKKKS